MKRFAQRVLLSCTACGLISAPAIYSRDQPPVLISRTAGESWSTVAELTAAAEKGNVRACAELGELMLQGNQVPKNPTRAVELLEKAARGGVPSAAFRIGMLLNSGEGVAQDRARALAYFRAAAAGGVTEAFHNIGASYASGRGVKRDYAEALGWLILASEHGAPPSGEEAVRGRIRALKRPELIATGEKRAQEIPKELKDGKVADLLPPPAPFDSSATPVPVTPPAKPPTLPPPVSPPPSGPAIKPPELEKPAIPKPVIEVPPPGK